MPLRYQPAARTDIKDALRWSLLHFGEKALRRYKRLIEVALLDIATNPLRTHSYELSGLQPGIRFYHLRHSRQRARDEGQVVREPRHFIVYRCEHIETVIIRLPHERMEITRHLENPDEG